MARERADVALDHVASVFRAFCIGMDTARSLSATILLRNGEWEQLLRMKIHPSEYVDADTFARDYAVVSFLKKNANLPKITDTRAAAIAAFASSESQCRDANLRIRDWTEGGKPPSPRVVEVLHLAQRKISDLLSKSELTDDGPYLWGPGATFDLKRSVAYADTKTVRLPFSVTGGALKKAAALINSDLHWKEAIASANPSYNGPIFTIVPGGRYDTVPKTVLTDRSILVEPRLNSILQKRRGLQLRGLLKRVGVDLDDQSRNQYLASMAQELGLATLDLASASDTVCREVVRLLLPDPWYEELDALRSPWYLGDEGWVRLEKFSSMGNGFTFELESLIFWALSASATQLQYYSTTGIYGDDIIVRQEVVPLLVETLSYCGFSVNPEKSFVEGEFFESCGKHYFGGYDVTPLYQKCCPTTEFEAARMGNRLLRYAARLGRHVTLDKRVRGAWEEHRRRWQPPTECFGPYVGEGDGWWESPDSFLPRARRSLGAFGSWRTKVACYSEVKRVIPANDDAMYANWLMQTQSSQTKVWRWRGKVIATSNTNSTPSVSVKRSRSGVSVEYLTADSGMIASRLKPRYVIKHRWIEHPLTTALDW